MTVNTKDIFIRGAYQFGLFELGRLERKNKVPILCYHRFASSTWSDGALSPKLFDLHLAYLKKHFTIISFARLSQMIDEQRPVTNPLLVTIDDGYKDFAEVALPLLRKHGAPATLFVSTDFINGKIWLWPDVIHYLIQQTGRADLEMPGSGQKLQLRTPIERKEVNFRLVRYCKSLAGKAMDDFLEEISDKAKVPIPSVPPVQYQPASWENLNTAVNDSIEIGSHSVTHSILSRLARDRAETEIAESKKEIERRLSKEVVVFAYPNGMEGDYDSSHPEMLKKHGYRFGVTCKYGMNSLDSECYELNRTTAPYDMPHFVQEVSGFESLKRKFRALFDSRLSSGNGKENQAKP